MKTPMPPPDADEVLSTLVKDPGQFVKMMGSAPFSVEQRYLPWDDLRYRTPPEGLNAAQWWAFIKLGRRAAARELPLCDVNGKHFSYVLPDEVLEGIEKVNMHLGGRLGASEQVTNPATRDRFLISSLIEEAITSSQLEGASTSRQVAKDMIRTGRPPRSRDEQMILNNYHAMRLVSEIQEEEITPERVCEIHRIVTENTLDTADAAGRLQEPGEERVAVYADDGELLHRPPAAVDLASRLTELCEFANGRGSQTYVPPVIRAITVHFMFGYDHYFEDGNGRTARAVFYWVMLRHGFWMTEYLTISSILKSAPSRYARSFLLSEQDEGDLTHFHIYQLTVVQRAIDRLQEYLSRKADELRNFQDFTAGSSRFFNHRQLALLEHAVRHPGARYSVGSHSSSHNTSTETARQDLRSLEQERLLNKQRVSKAYIWVPVPDLLARLEAQRSS